MSLNLAVQPDHLEINKQAHTHTRDKQNPGPCSDPRQLTLNPEPVCLKIPHVSHRRAAQAQGGEGWDGRVLGPGYSQRGASGVYLLHLSTPNYFGYFSDFLFCFLLP